MKGESSFRLSSNNLLSFLLAESYIRKSNRVCLLFLKHLRNSLNNDKDKKNFLNFCKNNKVALEIVDGKDGMGGQFSLSTQTIIFQMTKDVLFNIGTANDDLLELYADILWTNFTHEDTHAQQASKSKVKLNYISPTNKFWDEDLGKDIDYFNQTVEADAYGREIAARLEKLYPTETVSNLFLRIMSNNIQDDYIKKIIGVYKDPRINDNANKAFFRSIYDFLKEEKEESK
jgi:hypothetical protein